MKRTSCETPGAACAARGLAAAGPARASAAASKPGPASKVTARLVALGDEVGDCRAIRDIYQLPMGREPAVATGLRGEYDTTGQELPHPVVEPVFRPIPPQCLIRRVRSHPARSP